jgi:hypothetical protein
MAGALDIYEVNDLGDGKCELIGTTYANPGPYLALCCCLWSSIETEGEKQWKEITENIKKLAESL